MASILQPCPQECRVLEKFGLAVHGSLKSTERGVLCLMKREAEHLVVVVVCFEGVSWSPNRFHTHHVNEDNLKFLISQFLSSECQDYR